MTAFCACSPQARLTCRGGCLLLTGELHGPFGLTRLIRRSAQMTVTKLKRTQSLSFRVAQRLSSSESHTHKHSYFDRFARYHSTAERVAGSSMRERSITWLKPGDSLADFNNYASAFVATNDGHSCSCARKVTGDEVLVRVAHSRSGKLD